MGILHAQFEIIHPFEDGNGRVGRIILPLFLYFKGILSSPMFYLSSYLEEHRDEYYAHLKNISHKNDWDSWILYFLKAVIGQAKENVAKAKAIHDLYKDKKLKIATLTRSQFSIQTLDFLFSYPLFTSSQFYERSKIPLATAKRILKLLEKNNIISLLKEGK